MNVSPHVQNIPETFHRFAREVWDGSPVPVHSITVVGSVLTPDYRPGLSDINSVIVSDHDRIRLLDFLVGLGRNYRKEKVAPPLVMSTWYIRSSLDAFPLEFLNFREIHHTLFGEDPLVGLTIDPEHLRIQCERESKSRLLWLGQVYLEQLADHEGLRRALVGSISGCLPLFRGILALHGETGALSAREVIDRLGGLLSLDCTILKRLLKMKLDREELGKEEMATVFGAYEKIFTEIEHHVDSLDV